MTNLILAGGVGKRLWPLSTPECPKQFLPLFHRGRSLFNKTILRNSWMCQRTLIVTAPEYVTRITDEYHVFEIMAEPVPRNTAAAVALACLTLPEEEIVLMTPADHIITKPGSYTEAVRKALPLAESGRLVVFGITPDRPETQYGYIEAHGHVVKSFHEKPNTETARRYLEARFLWNSGMLVFQVGAMLREMQEHCPEILAAARRAGPNPTREAMLSIPSLPLDRAVLEKSWNVQVVPCDIGWSDLGSFKSLLQNVPIHRILGCFLRRKK